MIRAGELGGSTGNARVTAVERSQIVLEFTPDAAPRAPAPVTVLLGHPRPIVLKRLVRDLTSIGVGRILVVPSANGEASYGNSRVWDEIPIALREGAAQASTTLVPELGRPGSLSAALSLLEDLPVSPRARILLHGESDVAGSLPPLAEVLNQLVLDDGARSVVLAIGSERGWVPDEVSALVRARFTAASLGSRVLRTETAATIACWAAVNALERQG